MNCKKVFNTVLAFCVIVAIFAYYVVLISLHWYIKEHGPTWMKDDGYLGLFFGLATIFPLISGMICSFVYHDS